MQNLQNVEENLFSYQTISLHHATVDWES